MECASRLFGRRLGAGDDASNIGIFTGNSGGAIRFRLATLLALDFFVALEILTSSLTLSLECADVRHGLAPSAGE